MIQVFWSEFKAYANLNDLEIQYVTDIDNNYVVMTSNGSFSIVCYIPISSPANADQTDFETNYQPTANKKLSLTDGGSSTNIKLLDEASSTITYVGEAAPGSSTASAVWKIKRLQTVATVTTIAWADGNENFDNIWNNRAILTYS